MGSQIVTEVILDRLGAILGRLGAILGSLGAILAVVEAYCGPFWQPLAVLAAIWDRLGTLFVAVFGASWAVLTASWSVLGSSWSVLERLGGILERLGRVLKRSGVDYVKRRSGVGAHLYRRGGPFFARKKSF